MHKQVDEATEDLQSNLLELQNQFDHYKQTKNDELLELKAKVEKMDEIEAELEKYQNQDDLHSEI